MMWPLGGRPTGLDWPHGATLTLSCMPRPSLGLVGLSHRPPVICVSQQLTQPPNAVFIPEGQSNDPGLALNSPPQLRRSPRKFASTTIEASVPAPTATAVTCVSSVAAEVPTRQSTAPFAAGRSHSLPHPHVTALTPLHATHTTSCHTHTAFTHAYTHQYTSASLAVAPSSRPRLRFLSHSWLFLRF